jgi:hypothetical protein
MNEIDEIMALDPEELMAQPSKRDVLIDYIRMLRNSLLKGAKITRDEAPMPSLSTLKLAPEKPKFNLRRL